MKLAFALLVILPLAFASQQERALNPIVSSISHLLHLDEFETLVEDIIGKMGGDDSEVACNLACPYEVKQILSPGALESIAEAGCGAICASIKQLAIQFNIHAPHLFNTTPAS